MQIETKFETKDVVSYEKSSPVVKTCPTCGARHADVQEKTRITGTITDIEISYYERKLHITYLIYQGQMSLGWIVEKDLTKEN